MSKVTIEWEIRAGGRKKGDRETVERTAYIDTLLAAKRVTLVEEHESSTSHPLGVPKLAPVVIQNLDDDWAALDADTGQVVPESLPEPGAEGLVIPMAKPGPRNRAHRQPE